MTDPALMSAETLLAHYARGTLSPIDALQAVLQRIARHNPRLNAFAVLNPRALAAAGESEARWRAGRPIGALDGVPCTVKDLIDLAGFPTRRGSRTTSAEPVAEDAPAVLGLKAAGAVIVGKTTTTEFGWKSPGDCPLHGITRNPWDTEYSPGGSSSGAGAAGAAGFGPLHVGTDAGGSVRIPAAWCGLVGLKPSFGRIPQWPLGAFAAIATAGPMARTVGDCALLLGALARFDRRDPYCLPDEARDWRIGLARGVTGLRIGILRHPGFDAPADADAIAAVEDAATLLADAGAHVEEAVTELPDSRDVFTQVWAVALARLVSTIPATEHAKLDAGLLDAAAGHGAMTATSYLAAEALRLQAAHRMAALHARFDVVLCPTVPAGPPRADAPTGDAAAKLWREWAPWTFLFNLTRQPALTIPMGPGRSGLPRSVQAAAALYRDDLVLRTGWAIEQAGGFSPATPQL